MDGWREGGMKKKKKEMEAVERTSQTVHNDLPKD